MKKIKNLALIMLVLMLLVGCSEESNTESTDAAESASIVTSEGLEENTDNETAEVNDTDVQEESDTMEANSTISSESYGNSEVQEEIIEITEQELIQGERYTYSIVMFRNEKTWEVLRWEISLHENQEFIQEIVIEYESAHIPEFREMIREEDVNFDGVKDLLIHTGYYGVQGSQQYECYLANAEQGMFVWCQGFKDIPNPKVDVDNQLICGWIRRNGSSYVDQFYQYTGGSFEFLRGDVYEYDEALGEHVYVYSYTKEDL